MFSIVLSVCAGVLTIARRVRHTNDETEQLATVHYIHQPDAAPDFVEVS